MEREDLREQFDAIRRALRRTGRQMVLMSTQALLRGLFVLGGAAASIALLHLAPSPGWTILGLWLGIIGIEGAIELGLYRRFARRSPGAFVTGLELQMLKFFAVLAGIGAVTAAALHVHDLADLIPPFWMLIVGIGYVSVGLFSFSETWILGIAACVAGATALFLPVSWAFVFAGLTLGLGSIVWSFLLAARARRRDG